MTGAAGRRFYTQPAEEAEVFLDELIVDMGNESMSVEVISLSRALRTGQAQLLHRSATRPTHDSARPRFPPSRAGWVYLMRDLSDPASTGVAVLNPWEPQPPA